MAVLSSLQKLTQGAKKNEEMGMYFKQTKNKTSPEMILIKVICDLLDRVQNNSQNMVTEVRRLIH